MAKCQTGNQVLEDGKRCCRTEERCLEKKVTLLENTKLCMEKNCLSSWLREEGKVKEERKMEMDKETEEETSQKRTREEEKEENETMRAQRRCVDSVSADAFDIFS